MPVVCSQARLPLAIAINPISDTPLEFPEPSIASSNSAAIGEFTPSSIEERERIELAGDRGNRGRESGKGAPRRPHFFGSGLGIIVSGADAPPGHSIAQTTPWAARPTLLTPVRFWLFVVVPVLCRSW